jgi:hypothetical protein
MVRHARHIVILFLTLLFGAAMAVMAQDDRYAGSTDAREHGYQHGYRDGYRQGRADLNSNADSNYESEDYRRGDLGYEEQMGPRRDFQAGYQSGYRAGYDDGYKNRPVRTDLYRLNDNYDPDRVPRSDEDAQSYADWGYSDVAFDTGYRDGLSAGSKDFRDGKKYRPEKHDSYEDAHHGYRKSYGPKDQYKEQYRKGFLRGYDDAFNTRGH